MAFYIAIAVAGIAGLAALYFWSALQDCKAELSARETRVEELRESLFDAAKAFRKDHAELVSIRERLQHAVRLRNDLIAEMSAANTELTRLRDLRARRQASQRKYAAKRKGRG